MTFEGTETLATAAGARVGAASEEEVASVWLLLVVSTAMSCTTLSLCEREWMPPVPHCRQWLALLHR